MKTRYTVALSMIAGAALGGAAVQGVNAQLAAKKAYAVSELEVIDAQGAAAVAQRIQAAQANSGGRNFPRVIPRRFHAHLLKAPARPGLSLLSVHLRHEQASFPRPARSSALGPLASTNKSLAQSDKSIP